jgi:GBP family porin
VKQLHLAVLASAVVTVSSASAQSSVTIYGIIDAGVMYTNNVAKAGSTGSLFQATSGGVNGSRFGFRGAEDLGGGLKAIFVLENGFNVQNGRLAQNGREFGRQAYVGLSNRDYGTITLGRQYDLLIDFVAPLSSTAGTFGDAGFAHPFDNDNLTHSVRMNNAVKYFSVDEAGFKFGALYAFSNSTDFATNRAYSFGASYSSGPLNGAVAYLQINGSDSVTNTGGAIDVAESPSNGTGGFLVGASRVRIYGAGINYTFSPAVVGFVYTRSVYQGTNSFGIRKWHDAVR